MKKHCRSPSRCVCSIVLKRNLGQPLAAGFQAWASLSMEGQDCSVGGKVNLDRAQVVRLHPAPCPLPCDYKEQIPEPWRLSRPWQHGDWLGKGWTAESSLSRLHIKLPQVTFKLQTLVPLCEPKMRI